MAIRKSSVVLHCVDLRNKVRSFGGTFYLQPQGGIYDKHQLIMPFLQMSWYLRSIMHPVISPSALIWC